MKVLNLHFFSAKRSRTRIKKKKTINWARLRLERFFTQAIATHPHKKIDAIINSRIKLIVFLRRN